MIAKAAAATLLCFAAMLVAGSAKAEWPERPVRIVVASAPGGGTDTVARVLGDYLSRSLGQQFYIENRPGAGNVLGSDVVARAAPDGYTFLMSASTLAINHVMYKKLPYDVPRDFAPITRLVALPNALVVGASSPYRTFGDFLAAAKAKPGALTFGSAGVGTLPHMAMELLKTMAGVDLTHVPYTGVAPALMDILGGRVTSMQVNYLSGKPQIDAGALRALAVSTLKRTTFAPDIPTIAESGVPDFEAIQWFGLLAPAGTPAAILQRVHDETIKGLSTPEMKARFAAEGAEPVGDTPAEFAAVIRVEMDKWARVAKAANIMPE
jgi:tripartite-type tricarboxylate transporter receptor subunit TctC